MSNSQVAFVVTVLANLAWISWGSFQGFVGEPVDRAVKLLAPSIASQLLFHLALMWQRKSLNQREIDSAYYLGFLITLMGLGAAALKLGSSFASERTAEIVPEIGLKFALGLLATGCGLVSRILLQSKLAAPSDAAVAIEAYVDGIGRLNDRIGTSAREIDRLIDQVLKAAAETSKKAGASVVATLADELDPSARRLSEAVGQLNSAIDALGSGPLKTLGAVTQGISARLASLEREIPSVASSLGTLANATGEAAREQGRLASSSAGAAESAKASAIAFDEISRTAEAARNQLSTFSGAIDTVDASIRKVPESADRLGLGLGAALNAMQSLENRSKELAASFETFQQALDPSAVRGLDRALIDITGNASAFSKGLEAAGRSTSLVGERFSTDIAGSAKKIDELARGMTTAAEQLGKAMERLAIAIRDAAMKAAG